jgi:hypothetical protein
MTDLPFAFEIGDPVRTKNMTGRTYSGIVYEREPGPMNWNGPENTYNMYNPLTDTYSDAGWFEWALELDKGEK